MVQETIDTNSLAKVTYPPNDGSEFKPLNAQGLAEILGLTIKRDDTNKVITFLAQLSAYTYDSQINLSFNAPSSTGKSFIPTEIANLFPPEDVMEVGYCSPTAFFHDVGKYDKEKQGYTVDLSRKILIFLDQPHTLLLQHLRPMLSHDKEEIRLKITDKSQKAGLRTKNIYLKGFPTVVFCTAGLNLDEQEATRFLLLSPEINQGKLRAGITQRINRESNQHSFNKWVDSDPSRKLLKERIKAIKDEYILNIQISNPELVENLFFERSKVLKPRHQRDIGRIISLVKVFTLLNLWFRKKDGLSLIATDDDIHEAFLLWDTISDSQELNLPPYVFNLYNDVILEDFKSKNSESGVKIGLSRQEILQKHYQVYGRYLPDWQLRQEIIPMLVTAGLIYEEHDPTEKRRKLVYPTTPLTISTQENNSEESGGVEDETLDLFSNKEI